LVRINEVLGIEGKRSEKRLSVFTDTVSNNWKDYEYSGESIRKRRICRDRTNHEINGGLGKIYGRG